MGLTAPPRARLLADGGAAATGEDFFRCAEFLAAEGCTHSLVLESASRTAAVPLIVREIPGGGGRDAVSPYGYPGATITGDGPPPSAADWSPTGLVSIFGRERVRAPQWLDPALERGTLQLYDPARPRAVRGRLAEQIRASERDGWSIARWAGPEVPVQAREGFARAYEQTMHRTGAAPRYFFDAAYIARLLDSPSARLLVAERGGAIGAAAIVVRSDGVLHYFLGGTADAALAASPFKLVTAAMLALADEDSITLNLGGGVRPGDGLERFKRGFANDQAPFRTQEVVCARADYERLAAPEAGGWFPAYRAGG